MLHNACISRYHVKVSIDFAIDDDALLPIPLDEDIITIGGAIGTFVAWPIDLIQVVPYKENVHSTPSRNPKTKPSMCDVSSKPSTGDTIYCR
ncbi:hypothetical protein TanjilG_20366 [Lupinus angustifolius]|uniref:DUF8039 domain-containing protein n=2 Tax=Lupinus angustifolius TaxID=3871 RepID=A0A4P1RWA7_LUPAN|nr:hypothetical protein TanjilG_20366 [Lupinus angustifolius]